MAARALFPPVGIAFKPFVLVIWMLPHVPGHEGVMLQRAVLGTEPTAESHWENPPRATVIAFY